MTKRRASPDQDQDAHLSSDLQEAFGLSVRAARIKAGMTQANLAERSNVSRDDISRIENGQINLTIRTMSKLAAVFDGDVAKMLQATKSVSKPDETES
jgi:transcriptional regulator with XRE-family HTH domain